ncbi:hypothetical protein HYPDE_28003 [Hyphomicrobium denitrificans 1NES1]|uniref:Uncharacterized protein n=1 Tax=Hyphomicrobium denitrificans 1NES1 TaxID=670307 RepID=N0BAY0_9HYPH|nr:hypothetical protein HYPDE_28003 [Hyphomicrobium denitrificans 1NES1]
MPSVREVDVASPTSAAEPSPQEIDSMMAEAIAVDALLQRKHPGTFDVMLAISVYLSSPARRCQIRRG